MSAKNDKFDFEKHICGQVEENLLTFFSNNGLWVAYMTSLN